MKGDFLILIVDDSRMNRIVLSDSLSREGYELAEAESADDALRILGYRKPELILLDVLMPQMSGFDLCRLLKQQKSTREIPIIFITSLDSTEDKIKGFELGAVDFITKPFNTAEILARVRTQVTLRHMYRTILETPGLSFVCVAHDTLGVTLRICDGTPFDAGGKTRPASACQAGVSDHLDGPLWLEALNGVHQTRIATRVFVPSEGSPTGSPDRNKDTCVQTTRIGRGEG